MNFGSRSIYNGLSLSCRRIHDDVVNRSLPCNAERNRRNSKLEQSLRTHTGSREQHEPIDFSQHSKEKIASNKKRADSEQEPKSENINKIASADDECKHALMSISRSPLSPLCTSIHSYMHIAHMQFVQLLHL